jgi:murein DD-endopeptidase MepM/ murein hydrolase activator NlpD
LKREIPQKVDLPPSASRPSQPELAGSLGGGLTLLRRTRSSAIIGCVLTIGAVGLAAPQQSAAARQFFQPDLGVSASLQGLRGANFQNSDLASPVPGQNSLSSTGEGTLSPLQKSLQVSDALLVQSRSEGFSPTLPSSSSLTEELIQSRITNHQLALAASEPAVTKPIANTTGHALAEIANKYEVPMDMLVSPPVLDRKVVVPTAGMNQQLVASVHQSRLKDEDRQDEKSLVDAQASSSGDLVLPEAPSSAPLPTKTMSVEELKRSLSGQTQSVDAVEVAAVNAESTPLPDSVPEIPSTQIDIPIAARGPIPQIPSLELPSLNSESYLPDQWQSGPLKFIWPAKGVFTSGYGWRWGRMHRGIDVAAPVGTPVVASAPGIVTYSQFNDGGFGNLIEITHPDGSQTLYAHNSRLLVREGQFVSQGQQIADMGSTGRSTGPHTHFELHKAGQGAIDPVMWLNRG